MLMNKIIYAALLSVLFVTALPAAKAPELKVQSILASVNGEPISLLDVIFETGREEAKLCALYSGQELWEETRKLRKKVLEDIIARKLIYADYQSNPFTIPPQYIEDMMDALASEFAGGTRDSLDKKAKKMGTSTKELKEKAKIKVAVEMMMSDQCFKNILITPKDTYEYFQQHKEEFSTPAQVEIEMIFLKDNEEKKDSIKETIREITEDTKSGDAKIFRSLAVLHSEGPNAENGGSLGWIDETKLRSEFAAALKGASPGTVAGPVKTEEGVYFLRLAEKKTEENLPFEGVEAKIKERLEQKEREIVYKKYIEDLKSKAVVRYYF